MMKRILIAGYGRMGALLGDLLIGDNEIAIYDTGIRMEDAPLSFVRLSQPEEAAEFKPDILLNCTSPESTITSFDQFLPFLPGGCILADIASVKSSLPEYYSSAGVKFVSLHPMFGPTFANRDNLKGLNCIIIAESEKEGREFFSSFFSRFGIDVQELSFAEHDMLMSKVLAVPFITTLLFTVGSEAELPGGTTYNRHLEIARGLFSENRAMLAGILANRYNAEQAVKMLESLKRLVPMLEKHDTDAIEGYIAECAKKFRGAATPDPQ
ncbi:MAG: prephenate dehydrogenase/arogenate dehydrogenase family protein [Bacteroidales bacterium]